MHKKLKMKSVIFALFLLLCIPLFSLDLTTCTSGDKQYKPDGDCGTTSRICCGSGLWSTWGGDCSYRWSCRQVPKSYCAGMGSMIPSVASGSLSGMECSPYGKEGFSSGTTDGGPILASGTNTACYQCKCGAPPTNPACNCSGLSSGGCTAYKNGMQYMGTRKCVGGCLWDDCYPVDNPEGEYCGLTPGKTYQCTPAAYSEHGGYQVCESAYNEPGQLKISSCKACGEMQCLARSSSGGINSSDARYYCVSKPSSGQDTKGKYKCNAASCSNAGMTTSPWTCTSKTYTSCFTGYTLSYGNCVSNSGGGGGLRPIDPGEIIIK